MAELKPAAGRRRQRDRTRFHGVTTVAELKPAVENLAVEQDDGFHGVTTVAELKRGIAPRVLIALHVSTVSQPWPN